MINELSDRILNVEGYIADLGSALEEVERLRIIALEDLQDLCDIDSDIVQGVIASYQGLDDVNNCCTAIETLKTARKSIEEQGQ